MPQAEENATATGNRHAVYNKQSFNTSLSHLIRLLETPVPCESKNYPQVFLAIFPQRRTHTHTQPFNGLWSRTTQKKHSPTHTHSDYRTSSTTKHFKIKFYTFIVCSHLPKDTKSSSSSSIIVTNFIKINQTVAEI